MGKQRITQLNLTFGIHHLAAAGILGPNDRGKLEQAVAIGYAAGATLIEIVGPINGLSIADTAEAILDGGMTESAVCVFFAGDGSMGDPLGVNASFVTALDTMKRQMDMMAGLRARGIKINTMTGPNGYRLGYEYGLSDRVLDERLLRWYGQVDLLARDAGVTVTVEALRPKEDRVLKSTPRLKALIRQQGTPRIKAHFDIFHAFEQGEFPAESIELLGGDLGWLHGHGSKRRAPGSAGEQNDWGLTHMALEKSGYTGAGHVLVVEPFCPDARTDIPALGEDLPDADEPAAYMTQAGAFLRQEGFIPRPPLM